MSGESDRQRRWNFWKERKEQSRFELGLCTVDDPVIADAESGEGLTVYWVDPDWEQNWVARGELTPV